MNLLGPPIFKILFSLLICLNALSAKTRLSLRQAFNATEFAIKLTNNSVYSNYINSATLDEMPALSGEKLSYYFTTIEPCHSNTVHLHPRASELLFVIEGTDLQVGFMEENGGRVILNKIGAGHAMLYPKGLMHFESNLGCAPVRYLSAMNNEDPGLITVINRVFDLPALVVQTSINLTECQYLKLKCNIPVTQIVTGIDECKKRCNSNNAGSIFDNVKNLKIFNLVFLNIFVFIQNRF